MTDNTHGLDRYLRGARLDMLLDMLPNVIFLTGAPSSRVLNWYASELLDDFDVHVARFIGESNFVLSGLPTLQSGSSTYVPWRALHLARQHLTTGHSQIPGFGNDFQGGADFFNPATPDFLVQEGTTSFSTESSEDIRSDYYERSFAVHANLASSQIPSGSSVRDDSTSGAGKNSVTNSEKGFEDAEDTGSAWCSTISIERKSSIPVGGQLSDLEDIPNAAYLQKILPQTMTVNLIVGIISISPPRSIHTRRGADVELIEVLVGDETKSGFGINFWLNTSAEPSKVDDRGCSLKRAIESLRPQEIILVRNLALSTFRGKVYGQSLRKEMTKVHLVFRNRVDKRDVGGCYTLGDLDSGGENEENMHPQLDKTRRVREWVLRFVEPAFVRRARQGFRIEVVKEVLPPDTQ